MHIIIETLNFWGTRFTAFTGPIVIQSALLIGLLLGVDLLLRQRARATVRYALWMLVLVKLVLPPSFALPTGLAYWLPGQSPSPPHAIANPRGAAATLPVAEGGAKPLAKRVQPLDHTPARVPVLTWPAMLFTGWLAVFLGLAARVGWRFRKVTHILQQTTAAPESIQAVLESCRRQLHIRQAVQIRCTFSAVSPAICGLFRPIIVIPVALPGTLSESGLRSILLHELAHWKRGDVWVNHLQILLQLFYWYNPLVWLANATIRRIREQAVDEMVLVELRGEAVSYPETLVQVARMALLRPSSAIGFVGILEPGSCLTQRIRHMLNHPAPQTVRLGLRGLLLIAFIALAALPMGRGSVSAAVSEAEPPSDATSVALSGTKLTPEQVRELEEKLRTNAEDISARSQLLGYYSRAQYKSKEARQARQAHVLWLIEHHPDTAIFASGYAGLDRILDGSEYGKAKTLWLKQVEINPKHVAILGHAAKFCLLQDRTIAEDFLKRAQALEPGNPKWSVQLAHLYALDADHPKAGGGTESGRKALEQMEKAQAATADATERFSNLDYLAGMAFRARDMEKARRYATEFLQQAEQNKSNWAYGNAINHGNVILGRIALREGSLDAAKKHLLAAGTTPGSPQLNSFGPNMALAKELIEKGETETILAYFNLCANFWSMGSEKLELWAKEVTAGIAPNFGGNLNY